MNELKARFFYFQLCRSLRTYGVSFFLVEGKVKGRNRLMQNLLGIAKESILQVDASTKEVLKIWPLTSIIHWAASPTSFTLVCACVCVYVYSVPNWLFLNFGLRTSKYCLA